nr:MAG TPA: hypothetical protein [Caudoviricetes sp.]DAQ94243.1 MAG TPA: hypothetical protein [Caudoviricetes sp.]DAT12347.1 MAG TPA: hypothetical protein [Caudoviricetes sp.]
MSQEIRTEYPKELFDLRRDYLMDRRGSNPRRIYVQSP